MLSSSNEARIYTNMVYLLADVMETLMMDSIALMKRNGEKLKHESKRDFNAAIANIRKMKNSTINGCLKETQNDYGNDADHICELLKLIVDRVGRDDRVLWDIYEYVKSKSSNLNMTTLDDSFCESIELEEKRKAEKHIALICKVFNIEDFHEKFSKDAYYARILVVKSLQIDGIRDKFIADNLNLSVKTVKRLSKDYAKTFTDNKVLLDKQKEFFKLYMNEEAYIKSPSRDAEVA